MHFLIITFEPISSYSSLVIHCDLNVDKLANTDPPIHTDYFLSFWVITCTFVVWGTNLPTSFSNLAPKFSYIDEPPDKIMFSYCDFLAPKSTLSIDVCNNSWILFYSLFITNDCPNFVSNKISGHWWSSLPNLITLSSGNLTSTNGFLPSSKSLASWFGSNDT